MASTDKLRTVGQIFAAAEAIANCEKDEKRRKAEEERTRRLEAVAKREGVVWDQVTALIKQKKTTAYDEAVKLLRELRELADYRGYLDVFRARVLGLQAEFPTLSGLKSRIISARLLA